MKVELKISPDCKEPYIVVHTAALTDEISKMISTLESSEQIIAAYDDEKIIVLRPEDIYMARIEEGELMLYTEKECYHSKKRLYEITQQLGREFLQISKSATINLKKIVSVEPSFNGMMLLKLNNGCKEYISRKYLPDFKKYLGI